MIAMRLFGRNNLELRPDMTRPVRMFLMLKFCLQASAKGGRRKNRRRTVRNASDLSMASGNGGASTDGASGTPAAAAAGAAVQPRRFGRAIHNGFQRLFRRPGAAPLPGGLQPGFHPPAQARAAGDSTVAPPSPSAASCERLSCQVCVGLLPAQRVLTSRHCAQHRLEVELPHRSMTWLQVSSVASEKMAAAPLPHSGAALGMGSSGTGSNASVQSPWPPVAGAGTAATNSSVAVTAGHSQPVDAMARRSTRPADDETGDWMFQESSVDGGLLSDADDLHASRPLPSVSPAASGRLQRGSVDTPPSARVHVDSPLLADDVRNSATSPFVDETGQPEDAWPRRAEALPAEAAGAAPSASAAAASTVALQPVAATATPEVPRLPLPAIAESVGSPRSAASSRRGRGTSPSARDGGADLGVTAPSTVHDCPAGDAAMVSACAAPVEEEREAVPVATVESQSSRGSELHLDDDFAKAQAAAHIAAMQTRKGKNKLASGSYIFDGSGEFIRQASPSAGHDR